MGNLVLYYGKNKNIRKIVSKYQEMYQAECMEIETVNEVSFIDKVKSVYANLNIPVKRSQFNLNNFDMIILVSELWFSSTPTPVIRFLEQQTGKIKKIIYVLYNKNKEDKAKEFDKMDKILNLRREKSYFVSIVKNDIHVRVYQ